MPECRWIALQELRGRRPEWHALAAASEFPTVFVDPGWILAWWEDYGARHEPWLLGLEDGGGALIGLAPFALRRSRLARTLELAGGRWNGLETLLSAPGREAELSSALVQALGARRSEWDVLRLQRLRAGSALERALLEGDGPLRAAAHDRRLQPYVTLPADVAAFEASFSSKERGAQRRKWRRLGELGAVARLISDPEEIAPAVGVLLDLRRRRAIALGQGHEHMDARYERFLVAAVRGMFPDGVRLWMLERDGHTLASCLHFVQGAREHSYTQGIADDHVNLSPGGSLELHAMREGIEQGRTEFELGPGRDDYKYRLGARDREVTRLVLGSGSPRGRAVTGVLATDLRLRNTAAADALRRRRGLTPERG
jgi:CelD/BcsL family acetyltransferase involved in cellulose biosynthesis